MTLIATFWGTLLDILPIAAIIFGFQYLVIRRPVKRLSQVLTGFSWYGLGSHFSWLVWNKRCFPWVS
ncbi:hypothetical protein HSBAA_27760 [Vreelandella sulfidaeris]|uniref:Uncharacterized protein n=1 Tax=Vreelandella sulfidaeris TaxID=115553 RepID=A0A455U5P6_9GAMM|nr:hypothetical protein HSBAA_27760 [Halomonas sulfidaeris]